MNNFHFFRVKKILNQFTALEEIERFWTENPCYTNKRYLNVFLTIAINITYVANY